MPAYDFRCTSCEHVFEVIRPAGRAAEDVCCPVCAATTKRVFTPVGVVFKGTGFHNTDNRSKPADDPSDSKAAPAPSCGSADACTSCPAAKK